MATPRKSPKIPPLAVMLAASLVMVATVISVTPAPAVSHPNVEVTTPQNTLEMKVSPASAQKNSEEPSKNEKHDKKKGPIVGMLLGLFGAIAGHQSATR